MYRVGTECGSIELLRVEPGMGATGGSEARPLELSTPQDDEITLIDRMRAGDEEAWSMAYEALHRDLLGYLRFRGARDPEDTLSEVFLRLARRIKSFTGTLADLRRYAFVVAGNLLKDEARARSRRPQVVADLADFDLARSPVLSAEDVTLGSAVHGLIPALLSRLTPEQQHVVFLRVVADLDVRETARVVGRSGGAVKMAFSRAMATLRDEVSFDDKGIIGV